MNNGIRILITGSRNFSDWAAMKNALTPYWVTFEDAEVTLVHGGCSGADTIAGDVAASLGWTVEVHPADWERYGRRAGPLRNQEMVDSGADVCLAFPIGESRGTRDCMARAEKAGIPVVVVVVFDDLT